MFRNPIENANKANKNDIDTIKTHRFSFVCKHSLTIIVKVVIEISIPKIIKPVPRVNEK